MTFVRRFSLALLLMGTIAGIAQTDTGTPTPATAPPKVRKALSSAEMLTSSEQITSQIKEDYQHVLRLQGIARKQKDVIKLSCVNDKLVELKAQMNIADGADQQLHAVLGKGEDGASLYSQLEGNGNAIKEIREQANGCIGQPELFKQEAGIEVSKPETPDDPGVIDPYSGDQGVVIEPPGYASPFN